jgi:hypothetical protein
MTVFEILEKGTPGQVRALFQFSKDDTADIIEKKFKLWSRYFFPRFFQSKDAPFHKQIDQGNIGVYLNGGSFVDIAFRGAAKTTRTKLFIAFVIANDQDHQRRFFKVLSKDIANAKQSTTDVYNMLISRRVKALYPEIFEKTDAKREETMASFTTATGVKMTADSIGTDQRGDIQDESRPDFLFFDDFETRASLMSAVTTHKIWQNMDEAFTGLAKGGAAVYTCNYLSERGNVHRLVLKSENKVIIPIESPRGTPTWDRYTDEDVRKIEREVEDFEGDYLCKPAASKDVYFDRDSVDRQVPKDPIDEVAGLKIFRRFDPSHRIGSGHDVAAGVGLDSSTSVFMDFDTMPIQVIATYRNNEIKPNEFAHEIARQAKRFGECLVAPEKNYGSTLDILRTIYPTSKIFKTPRDPDKIQFHGATEYGWETNGATKPTMLADFAKAIEDGLIALNDKDLIAEARAYTRGDLMDREVDPRLTTRHFDLLIAACIAYQTNKYIKKPQRERTADPLWPKQPRAVNPAR